MAYKFILVASFLFLSSITFAQLAKVVTQDPQRSSFKTLGRGLNLSTDYGDDNILYSQFHEVIDFEDGFYKVGVNNNKRIHQRKNLSIHIIKLDKNLQIQKEFEIELQTKRNNNYVTPFALYKIGNKIELLANNRADGEINIINWEFNLTDFSVIREDNVIGSFAVPNNSYCDFMYDINDKSGFGGISFIERKGKKSKECAIHSLSWNNNQKKLYQHTTDLSIEYQTNILSKVRTSITGAVWTLIDIREKELSVGSAIFHMNENNGKLTAVLKENSPVVGASITIDKTNSGILVGGFIPNKASAIYETLYLGLLNSNGILVTKNELQLTENFIAKSTKLDKLPKAAIGLSKHYFIREILLRDSDIIDVVASYVFIDEHVSQDGFYTKYKIGDIHIHSFSAEKLISSICINRNIEDKQSGRYESITMKKYSLPFLYTANNNLVMLFVANSNNSMNKNNSDLEKEYLGKSQFVAVKIDQNQKITKQLIFDPEEKLNGFGIFAGIILREIKVGHYFAYHETEFTLAVKAKLTFLYINMK